MSRAARSVTRRSRRLRVSDLILESLSGIAQRPGRSTLSILGTAIAVAAFVAVLGLTSTAGGQISGRFTKLSATEVTLTDTGSTLTHNAGFDPSSEDRVRSLAGVLHAGVFWPAPVGSGAVRRTPDSPGESLTVMAASPDLLRAVHAQAVRGVLYDEFHDGRSERVAVLGSAAAARLGISRLDAQPAVFVKGVPLTVVGIVGAVDRQPDLLLSVMVPASTAQTLWDYPTENGTKMLIETAVGAASVVASQAAVAARPDDAARLQVSAPPDPRELKESVGTDLNLLFIALAGVALLVGAVGIANTMVVAVMERVGEIGLRRSLGAGRGAIASQFVLESSAIGLMGGVVGAGAGIAIVVGACLLQDWTPLIQPQTVLASPIIGSLTGLLAGLYPAHRASRIEPADALRR